MDIHSVWSVVLESLIITAFVVLIMILIEYINVVTKGSWSRPLQKSSNFQLLLITILGAMPGCMGAYAVVAMYTHNLIKFGTLVAAMIAAVGDEAFVMYTMIPNKALWIQLIIIGIALIAGFIINTLKIDFAFKFKTEDHLKIHKDSEHEGFKWNDIRTNFKNLIFPRAFLLFSLVLLILYLILGGEAHSHEQMHDHSDHQVMLAFSDELWLKVSLFITSIVALFIVVTVSNHFLEDHLWGHVVKAHFLKVFLWTVAALLFIRLGLEYFNLDDIMNSNQWLILAIALLIGVIPESGPHIVFISLYATGNIPLSILLANSIVQDGHGALPLFAESKRNFFLLKSFSLMVGLIVGAIGIFVGF